MKSLRTLETKIDHVRGNLFKSYSDTKLYNISGLFSKLKPPVNNLKLGNLSDQNFLPSQ